MKATQIIILAALAAFLSSCNSSPSNNTGTLDAEAFDQMVRKSSEEIILDVRTRGEFEEGHIPGAVLIDVNESDFKQEANSLDKSKPVFVYCAAGIRSKKAAAILKDSGFKTIYHLEDGLKAWSKAQKELTK